MDDWMVGWLENRRASSRQSVQPSNHPFFRRSLNSRLYGFVIFVSRVDYCCEEMPGYNEKSSSRRGLFAQARYLEVRR